MKKRVVPMSSRPDTKIDSSNEVRHLVWEVQTVHLQGPDF